MSEDNEADATVCCASCGSAENDNVTLKNCTACYLVKYCGIKCQKDHRKQHKRACKKRAAELREELLFKQPESSCYGDCPICSLPLPLDDAKSALMACCSKKICHGCTIANKMREIEMRLEHTCPFCREAVPKTTKACYKQNLKRVKMNDPTAMCHHGMLQYEKGHYSRALEHWIKAAELDYALAHYHLAHLYLNGEGVEKDEGKGIYHLEEAAIGGNPDARRDLGLIENKKGNTERAVKHVIIAATQGHDESIELLMDGFKQGRVSNEELASALRAHKAAVDATKSPQRKKAEDFIGE